MPKNKSGRKSRRVLLAKYRLPLYENFYLWVVVTPTMVKTVKEIFPNDEHNEAMLPRTEGLIVYRPNAVYILLNTKGCVTHSTIAHELTHACQYFCEMMGIKVLPRNHEPYAYMVGHLTEVVYRKMKQWRIEVK